MMQRDTHELIASLAAKAEPVKPLGSPVLRAVATIATLAALGAPFVIFFSTANPLAMRGPGSELQAGLELISILVAGIVSIVAAFHLAVPGRSRSWLLIPLPALAVWVGVSGLGCWRDLVRNGAEGWEIGHSMSCLYFISTVSLLLGPALAWRLSRASPIDPLPVAAYGGLGAAAMSAFFLQFFHPFAVTLIDLSMHLLAVAVVVVTGSAFRRPLLRSA